MSDNYWELIVIILGLELLILGLITTSKHSPFLGAFGIFIFLIGLTIILTKNLKDTLKDNELHRLITLIWLFGLILALALLSGIENLPNICSCLK